MVDAAPANPWRRAILLALLVLAVGSALGAVGFAAEQRLFVWKPDVKALPGGGWRITGSAGLRPLAPALAGDRLAWSQAGYTCLMELASGDTKVIGAASRVTDLWPPALDTRSAAWLESDKNGVDPAHLWVYDIGRGRRVAHRAGAAAEAPALSDPFVAWLDDQPDGHREVTALDVETGRRSALVTGDGLSSPVIAGDDAVGWLLQPTGDAAPTVVVRDLGTGTETAIMLASAGSGLTVGDIQMAGRLVLWTQRSSRTTRIVAYDLESRQTTTVADGAVETPATDGEVVVWAQPDGTSPHGCVVMMRGLGGGPPSVAARPAAWPAGLAVGGGRLAWVINDGTWTYLDVMELPS